MSALSHVAISPRITRLDWGRLEVEGQPAAFKDAKLFPGGAREWDWNETGTRHRPGIQPEDVRELVEHGARVIVLSLGQQKRLNICPETLKWLDARGVETHVRETGEAVDLYNRLAESEPVGALIHSTC